MSAVLARIRSKVGEDSLSRSCGRDGCRVNLEGVPACRVIVDMDKIPAAQHAGGKRCDFVLFLSADGEGVLTAPIELKSGRVDASHAIEQLRSGAEFVNRVSPAKPKPRCQPILFHGKGIHSQQRKALNRSKVTFRGSKLTIKTARCCRSRKLDDVLGM